MVQVSWSKRAVDDLDAIRRYIEQFDTPAAARLAARLVALGQSLADFPVRGTPIGAGLRQIATVRPYLLRYQYDGDTVQVLAIRHGAQSDE